MPAGARLRFAVGDMIMCNLGGGGWRLGRVIALDYREAHWPSSQRPAPYQVALEGNDALIYVPHEAPSLCRAPTPEDLNIARRLDALAGGGGGEAAPVNGQLRCGGGAVLGGGVSGYRDGSCHGCDPCPRQWTAVEIYSEHYRAAQRNGLRVTQRKDDLGVVRVGGEVRRAAEAGGGGFSQCPTLARLPPGVGFTDAGALTGTVAYDPHRPASYRVEFVAVSTAAWDDPAVGLVRLEVSFTVEGNTAPPGFDAAGFEAEADKARAAAQGELDGMYEVWGRWEEGALGHRGTVDGMSAHLDALRAVLEKHPRLDCGAWWGELGGFHMNVHKLLEDKLFECELYLGHALTSPDAEVRRRAEQNLEGCYSKRLLEAARFMWYDALAGMKRGEWGAAAAALRCAANKKDGWGWGVNHGDIWIAEAAARLVLAAGAAEGDEAKEEAQLAAAARLVEQAEGRCGDHPWTGEVAAALAEYRGLRARGGAAGAWLPAFQQRTAYWCALGLGGAPPFPPRPAGRAVDAEGLRRRLPQLTA